MLLQFSDFPWTSVEVNPQKSNFKVRKTKIWPKFQKIHSHSGFTTYLYAHIKCACADVHIHELMNKRTNYEIIDKASHMRPFAVLSKDVGAVGSQLIFPNRVMVWTPEFIDLQHKSEAKTVVGLPHIKISISLNFPSMLLNRRERKNDFFIPCGGVSSIFQLRPPLLNYLYSDACKTVNKYAVI